MHQNLIMKTGTVAYTPIINLKIPPKIASEKSTDSQEQEVLINVSFLQIFYKLIKLFVGHF
jgi:hypothetical protein